MDPIVSCAERVLLDSAHPALRLSELLACVAEHIDRTLDAARLRFILGSHPERFRILDPWKGSWHDPDATSAHDSCGDTWVVAISEPGAPPDGAGPVEVGLRESVRWLARGVDARSRTEVGRWHAIAVSARDVRSEPPRRAA